MAAWRYHDQGGVNFRNSSTGRRRAVTRRRWPLLAAALVVGLAVLSCTLGSSTLTGGPSGEISDGERMAALDDIAKVAQDSMLQDGQIDRGVMLDHLTSDSHFEAAGQAPDGSIWANFKDGRMVIIPPETPYASGEEPQTIPLPSLPFNSSSDGRAFPDNSLTSFTRTMTSSGKLSAMIVAQDSTEYDFPKSEVAMTMSSLGYSFGDASEWIDRALRKSKYVSAVLPATVENLAAVQNVGVFYFATHGGYGCLGKSNDCLTLYTPSPKTPGPPAHDLIYALWTSTPTSAAQDAAYTQELTDKLLAYMLADPGDSKPIEWHYAITGKFVSTRMTFSENSLVYIDACSSQGIAESFRTAHASWFIGWTLPTRIGDRPFYFFDRLLGLGHDVSDNVKRAVPPNRPFDVVSVMDAMDRLGLINEPGPDGMSTLNLFRFGGSGLILMPSIERLVVDEQAKELEILGSFGGEQGSVTIDKVEVAVKEWASDKILVNLPSPPGPGSSGDVVVKVRKHESNAVPLTMWKVQFTYTEEPDFVFTGYNWLYLDVYWRADVHPYRLSPDDQVYDQEQVKLEPAEGSSGRWECDWSGTFGELSISTVEGEGELPFTRKPGAVGFTSQAKLDPQGHQITNLEFLLNFDEEHTCVTETTGAGYTVQTVGSFVLLPSLLSEVSPDYPMTPPLILDDQWVLERGNRDLMSHGQWPWLKWDEAPGEHAPVKDKTPG